MRCDHLASALIEQADGSAALEGQNRLHVEHCLRCQAELAQNRKLLRTLRSARVDLFEPPGEVLPAILLALDALGDAGQAHQRRRTRAVACIGGIAAATAAGAAGAIVLASRSRRRLPLAG